MVVKLNYRGFLIHFHETIQHHRLLRFKSVFLLLNFHSRFLRIPNAPKLLLHAAL